jgi:NAD(P)-dependent dehydrogenase (short-subunit alcohol dehydrogenase family)
MRSLAAEARRHRITTVLLDPGWVSTDMGGPDARAVDGRDDPGDRQVTARHNGGFFTREGREAPW